MRRTLTIHAHRRASGTWRRTTMPRPAVRRRSSGSPPAHSAPMSCACEVRICFLIRLSGERGRNRTFNLLIKSYRETANKGLTTCCPYLLPSAKKPVFIRVSTDRLRIGGNRERQEGVTDGGHSTDLGECAMPLAISGLPHQCSSTVPVEFDSMRFGSDAPTSSPNSFARTS
jgi:hypothetical protein